MDSLSSDTLHSPGTHSTLSRSSSKSVNVLQKDEDFTKDNVTSPIDLDCSIQSERINKIFDEAIYKIKLAICLPVLAKKDNQSVRALLTEVELDDVAFIYSHYENPLFSSSLQDMAVIDNIKSGDTSMKNRLNPELAHLIYVLNSYPTIKDEVVTHVEEMKKGYVSYKTKPANPALEFLLCMEHFRDLIFKQMEETAASLWAARVKTRKLEISKNKLMKKIQECTKTIEDETEIFNNTMKVKSKILADLEAELEMHDINAKYWQKKKIHYSDCQMVLKSRQHAVNMDLLREEDAQTQETYEVTLKNDMLVEKHKRAQRFKFEVQLISWLTKYDTDMSDKQTELDQFTEKWEDETKKIEVLEEQLAELDKEYLPLMQEREDEYQAEMTEKLNQFMSEHAARVLQVAWKTLLANRVEKKKLQKEVKAMREAEEKRQRIADAIAKRAAIAAAQAAKEAKKKKRR